MERDVAGVGDGERVADGVARVDPVVRGDDVLVERGDLVDADRHDLRHGDGIVVLSVAAWSCGARGGRRRQCCPPNPASMSAWLSVACAVHWTVLTRVERAVERAARSRRPTASRQRHVMERDVAGVGDVESVVDRVARSRPRSPSPRRSCRGVPSLSRSMVTTCGTGTVVESVSVASSAALAWVARGPRRLPRRCCSTWPASMSAWVMA